MPLKIRVFIMIRFASINLELRLRILIIVFTLSFIVFGAWSFWTLQRLEVNGVVYKDIVKGKDYIADILPPPAYIVESHLLALEIVREKNPDIQVQLIARFRGLKSQFIERHAFWRDHDFGNGEMQERFSASEQSAKQFFEIAENQLFPALSLGNRNAIELSLDRLHEKYADHRRAIDALVVKAQDKNTREEENAKRDIQQSNWILLGTWVLCLLAGSAASFGIMAKLRERESLTNALINEAADAILTMDHKGTVLTFNTAAEKIFGFSSNEVVNKNISKLMPQPFHSEHDQYLKNYLTTGQKKIIGLGREVKGLRKSGEEFPIELAVSEIHHSESRIFVGIIRDISTRKKIEMALRYSEEQFQLAMRGANDGLWDWNIQSDQVYFSPRFNAMLGHEDLGEKLQDWLACVHPDDLPSFNEGLYEHIRSQEDHFYHEHRVKHKDGHYFWVLSRAFVQRNPSGNAERMVGIYTDIHERKQVEKLKSEFVSTVSHELRTPLTAICGGLSLVLSGVMGELSSQSKSMLTIAQKNADRLLVLINDLLDMEKIQSGKLNLNIQYLDLIPIVRESIETNRPFAKQFDIEYEFDSPESCAWVYADETRLQQVITNFLSNAAKFSHPDSIVHVKLNQVDSRFRLSVVDQGVGISSVFHNKIFEKFSQVDSADTRNKGGTGLGLSICKALIEGMKGHIGFYSESNQGATFYFELPMARQDETSLKNE
jgi:PAS domain S-box-containing protein